jgi:hypothetical protein
VISGYLKSAFKIETEFGLLGSAQILLALIMFAIVGFSKDKGFNNTLHEKLIQPNNL